MDVLNKVENVLQNDNGLTDLQSAHSVYDTRPRELESATVSFNNVNEDFNVKADTIGLSSISIGVSSGNQVSRVIREYGVEYI